MKIIFFSIFLLACNNYINAQSFLGKNIKDIIIYYINPSDEYFSGTKVHEVISKSLNERRISPSLNQDSHYSKIRKKHQVDSFISLFKDLKVCRELVDDDNITNNIRIVVKIRFYFRKPEYVFLTGIDNQNVISESLIYVSNKNFYGYIMSLWSADIELGTKLQDGMCR